MRRCLAALVLVGLVAACAPTRAASPPTPELIGAQPVVPTTVAPPPAIDDGAATGAVVRAATPPGDVAPPTAPRLAEPGLASDAVPDAGATDRVASGAAEVDVAPDRVAVDEATPDPAVPSPDGLNRDGLSRDGLSLAVPGPAADGWAAFEHSLRRDLVGRGSMTASAAVVIDGEVIRSVAFGDRVPGTGDPAEPDDRFRIASISKPITAIVLLQLLEAGFVALDEPVGARLAAAVGLAPGDLGPGAERLTPEQLLSHRSGLPTYHARFFGSGAGSCHDVARATLTRSVGTPGGYRYSNMNYCLAGLLIEALTGQPYETAVYERLLTPLGISGMRLAGTYDAGPDEVAHYSRPGRHYMEALGGAGGWIASAPDIARIVGSLAPTATGWRPLSDEMLARMRRVPDAALPTASTGYGLGLFLFPDGAIGHTGTLEHTHAMVLGRPDGVTWVVLVNGEHPSESSALRRIVDRAFAAGFPDG